MGAEGAGWGREAGGEVACEEEREGGRREGGEEVGRGGYKCGGRGGRRGRVMKRHPVKSPAARRYGKKIEICFNFKVFIFYFFFNLRVFIKE